MPGLPAMPQAADPLPGSRLALVVATATYDDAALRLLRAPARDVADLAEVLADPGIGGFTVTTVIDQPAQQVRLAVEDFLAGRGTGDLLVVYLSCHGLLDARRRLYFAATDTRKDRLGSTGVESAWVLDQLDHCRARRQVLILDSCFSGAFAHGAKGQADLGLRDRFLGQGRGRVVLTASTATEYSFEGELADPATPPGSVFTAALVHGLRTGAADTDHDGQISVDDAYHYVFDQVQAAGAAQTPQRWLYGAEGQILLARSPAGPGLIPAPLPESLRAGLDSPHPGIRIGAVTELGAWLSGGDLPQAATARRHLQEVADNDIPHVARTARTFLDSETTAEPLAPADVEMLPSVDRRPTQRLRLPANTMRIGRTPDNDLVLADDFEASPHHAELRKSPMGGYEIVDLGSRNGTFVNGKRVSQATLSEHDIVSIGRSTFRLAKSELRQFVDEGEVSVTAQDLVVRLPDGKVLLDHVSFPIPEKCLLGVIGPSGAGKSTLLAALTGIRPADTGTVLYDNRDLYRHYAELRYRIGLVPQESVLHTQLTVRRALQYSAELRFPADTTGAERDSRIEEVMSELGLAKHADTRADRLSGGQLKRVNVAQELLTKPSLLLLDEPTSGLNPGLDKSIMEQMRDLAHDGRTVIVVTHSVANLETCDRLLVLVPGGRVAFYGPPSEALSYFGLPGWADVFQAFEAYPDRDWAAEFAASPAYAQYMTGPRWRPAYRPGEQQPQPAAQPRRRGALRQMTTLTRRYVRVIAADRGYLLFMGLLPIILGVLINFVGSSQGLTGPPHTNQNADRSAAGCGHRLLPSRDREFGQRTGQGAPDIHQGTGRRPVLWRLPVLQAHRARRHQHRAVRTARADRPGRPADATQGRAPRLSPRYSRS